MTNKKDTFCILPWMHIATTPSGTYRVCCNSTPEKNFILDNNGEKLKLAKHAIKDVWNTNCMKSLRKDMMNNIEPEICQRCFLHEKNGIKSARLGFNEEFKHLKNSLLKNTLSDGTADLHVGYIDIRLGNLCNLKCIMCNPYSSNQWINEWNLINETLPNETIKFLNHMDWFENNIFVEQLTPYLYSIEMIYLTGGEPTLSKSQYALLDKCIELDIAKNIILKYNTNLTNIPDKLLKYWKKFKEIRLNISIDAFDELNDYIRFPSKWKIIDKNLNQINSIAQHNKNWFVTIHCTVQICNILHITPLFDYLKKFEYIKQFPYLNVLNHPSYLNIKILPFHLKNKASDRLINWLENNKKYSSEIDGILQYMYDEDWSYLFEEFKTKTLILDKSRDVNIILVVPEFKDYLGNRDNL